LSEFMLEVCHTYEMPKNRMVPKCPVCGLSGMTPPKTRSRMGGMRLHGNMSLHMGWRG